jgi:hypothetical protein
MSRWQFLLADAAGAALWATAYLGLGVLFHRQVNRVIVLLGLFSRRAGFVLALLLAAFILWRYFQRVHFRRKLRVNRISPTEALSMMENEPAPMIVDLRNRSEVEASGRKIAGAVVLRPAELRAHFKDFVRDREVVLYCT